MLTPAFVDINVDHESETEEPKTGRGGKIIIKKIKIKYTRTGKWYLKTGRREKCVNRCGRSTSISRYTYGNCLQYYIYNFSTN